MSKPKIITLKQFVNSSAGAELEKVLEISDRNSSKRILAIFQNFNDVRELVVITPSIQEGCDDSFISLNESDLKRYSLETKVLLEQIDVGTIKEYDVYLKLKKKFESLEG